MSERRIWVLDTDTKGTGAEMRPLDRVERRPEPGAERVWVPPKRRPREPEPPEPRLPRRFRVVDVVTRAVLADDASVAETLDALGRVERMHDLSVYVWEPGDDRWRLLSLAEQEAVWRRRRPPDQPSPPSARTVSTVSASDAGLSSR
jgi:hypothetical protein